MASGTHAYTSLPYRPKPQPKPAAPQALPSHASQQQAQQAPAQHDGWGSPAATLPHPTAEEDNEDQAMAQINAYEQYEQSIVAETVCSGSDVCRAVRGASLFDASACAPMAVFV
jgi:hypothetical protein